MKLLKLALPALGRWLAAEWGWLVLLIAVGAAGAVYVAFRHLESDRAALLGFARQACASAGEGFDASSKITKNARGKQITARFPRGQLCAERIAALAKFERETAEQSARVLADHAQETERRTVADRAQRDAQGRASAQAEQSMEQHNATVPDDDRVDGAWLGALGRVAGMREPD
ncbi:MAG: hypothetical protein A4S12_07065 [Proteobacteria bacterium SG_bin5]|nr:hypothetical protein [Sphingomonas sp.]OQW42092.1 MAG: hypothetical protein A4S12_07065 [Proteobacteria bacterium SG_bin5]